MTYYKRYQSDRDIAYKLCAALVSSDKAKGRTFPNSFSEVGSSFEEKHRYIFEAMIEVLLAKDTNFSVFFRSTDNMLIPTFFYKKNGKGECLQFSYHCPYGADTEAEKIRNIYNTFGKKSEKIEDLKFDTTPASCEEISEIFDLGFTCYDTRKWR